MTDKQTPLQQLEHAFRLAYRAAHPLTPRNLDSTRTGNRTRDEGASTRPYRRIIEKYERYTRNLALDLTDEITGTPKYEKSVKNRCSRRDCEGRDRRQNADQPNCGWCGRPFKNTE